MLAALDALPIPPRIVVVDGYVWLDEKRRKGLGAHLYDALDKATPVIGVAKTRFATATDAIEVFRGRSKRPLLVTAAGIDPLEAATFVRQMHGNNRVPTALKRVDQLSLTNGPVPTR